MISDYYSHEFIVYLHFHNANGLTVNLKVLSFQDGSQDHLCFRRQRRYAI